MTRHRLSREQIVVIAMPLIGLSLLMTANALYLWHVPYEPYRALLDFAGEATMVLALWWCCLRFRRTRSMIGALSVGTVLMFVLHLLGVLSVGTGAREWLGMSQSEFDRVVNSSGTDSLIAVAMFALNVLAVSAYNSEAAARTGEERFRQIAELAPFALVVGRMRDGRVLYANSRAAQLAGVSAESLRDRNIQTFIANEETYRQVQDAVRGRQNVEVQSVATCLANGSSAWIDLSMERMSFAGETCFVLAVRDVTERKLADDALRASEARLRHRAEFEGLIAELSTRFINRPADDFDDVVTAALGELATFIGAERATLVQKTAPQRDFELTHCWCSTFTGSAVGESDLWWRQAETMERLARGESLRASAVDQFPAALAMSRGKLEGRAVQSLIVVPIRASGRLSGGLALESVQADRDWTDIDVRLLGVAADMLSGALQGRRAEQALRESEQKYRSVFEAGLVGMAITAPDGRYLAVNDRLCGMLDYSRDEMLEKSWRDLTYAADLPRDEELMHSVWNGEINIHTKEKRYVRRGGGIIHAEVSIGAVRGGDQSIEYFLCLIQDITARKVAEENLRRSEEKSRLLVEHSPDVIVLSQRDGTIDFINHTVKDYTVEGTIGTRGTDYLLDEGAERYRTALKRVFDEGQTDRFEAETVDHQWWDIRFAPLRDGDEILQALVIGTEFTEKKIAEDLRRDRSRVLEQLARGTALPEILELLTTLLERQQSGALASILLYDRDEQCLRHAAGARLDPEYLQLIDGLKIGPEVGSCGTAAYYKTRVIVENTETNPLWETARDLVARFRLLACWSEPILSASGDLLGTFAIYHHEPHTPTESELQQTAEMAHLAGIAIEHLRTRNALAASEERLRDLIQTVDAIVWEADPVTWQFSFVTQRAETMLGYPVEAWLASPSFWPSKLHPADRDRVIDYCVTTTAAGQNHDMEYRMIAADKRSVWIHDIVRIVTDNRGRTRLRGLMLDVTERKQNEQLLTLQRELLELIAANTELNNLLNELCLRVEQVLDSGRCVAYLRDEGGEALKFAAGPSFPKDFAEVMQGRLVPGERGGSSGTAVFRNQPILVEDARRDARWADLGDLADRYRVGRCWSFPIRSERERAHGAIAFVGSAPGLPTAFEQQILSTAAHLAGFAVHRELAERERTRLEDHVRSAQKFESLGILAGGVAHDFNNLLMAMLGHAELARAELPRGSSALAHVDSVERAAERAASMCQRLLAYSGKGRFITESVDLNQTVLEIGDLLKTLISSGAQVRYELSADAVFVEADSAQVGQIVINLLTNASDALEGRGGAITIRTGAMHAEREYLASTYLDDDLPSGEYAFVEVADTGAGMTAETMQKAFDPFFSTKFSGRGLGLAAVLGIARSHRGAVKLDSQLGAGTTIRVLLPAIAGPSSPPTSAEDEPPVARPALRPAAGNRTAFAVAHPANGDSGRNPPDGASEDFGPDAASLNLPIARVPGGKTILVVDDEEVVRSVVTLTLEAAGFRVLTAKDGSEGLEIFNRHRDEIALVLLDLTMPNIGGEETQRRIRTVRADVPIVLTSGYDPELASDRLSDADRARFIQKPYRPHILVERIRAILQSASAEAADA